ncbi:MAG: proteasome subunit alpha [Crenarchaeota archaeon]|nr:proteasome subunit alpha [Thermoproteota archaeon]MCR8453401.1 proteasome subunit alpha [Thermoproteota archaeon]MCR8454955.1 proteasome subunit alpha [Thermoproteota archaeon]MCR8470739.1 proteasome subunit alpha [Thermoproteota archaeon]MCR8471824.1 proteasome subunit alpha [Thermoproteota archaeon]
MFFPPERMATAYDRSATLFDPRGRILQVLYARKAAEAGTPSCGLLFNDGVIITGKRKMSVLLMPNRKVFQVDDNIIATFAGYSSDGMFLVENAREYAASLRFVYGSEKPDVYVVARYISSIMHQATLYAGLRPLGVSIILGGVDISGPRLLFSDPGGSTVSWRAGVIGLNAKKGEKFLEEILKMNSPEQLTFDDAVKYAIAAILIALGTASPPIEIEVGYVKRDSPATIVTADHPSIAKLYEEAKKIFEEWKERISVSEEKEESEEEEHS